MPARSSSGSTASAPTCSCASRRRTTSARSKTSPAGCGKLLEPEAMIGMHRGRDRRREPRDRGRPGAVGVRGPLRSGPGRRVRARSDADRRRLRDLGWPDAVPARGTLLLLADPYSFPVADFLRLVNAQVPELTVDRRARVGRRPDRAATASSCDARIGVDRRGRGAVLRRRTRAPGRVARMPADRPAVHRHASRSATSCTSSRASPRCAAARPRARGRRARTRADAPAACTSASSSTSTGSTSGAATSSCATCSASIRSNGALAVGERVRGRPDRAVPRARRRRRRRRPARAARPGRGRGRLAVHVQRPRHPLLRERRPRRRARRPTCSVGVPLAGAFCAGEIGPVGGRNFLHGFTASVAVFGTEAHRQRVGCDRADEGGLAMTGELGHDRDRPTSSNAAPSTSSARLAMDAVQQANSGHPGTPMALAPLAARLVHARHDVRRDRPRLARPRPLRALGRARVDARVLDALPLRARPRARRPPRVPPVGLEDARPPREGPHQERRGHHRAARSGHRQRGRHRARGEAPARSASAPSCATTTCSRSAATATSWRASATKRRRSPGTSELGHLVAVYDDNHITIDGATELTYTDDVPGALPRLRLARARARRGRRGPRRARSARCATAWPSEDRPTLLVLRSHIGYPSPQVPGHAEGARRTRSAPTRSRAVKEILGLAAPTRSSSFPTTSSTFYRAAGRARRRRATAWERRRDAVAAANPERAEEFDALHRRAAASPVGSRSCRRGRRATSLATRVASQEVLARDLRRRARPHRRRRRPHRQHGHAREGRWRSSRPRTRAGASSTSASASTAWPRPRTASRCRACCRSSGRSSCSATTCARRCGSRR